MKNLLILASGSGSNAENIFNYFVENKDISIQMIGSNRTDAYVLQRAANLRVPSFTFSKSELEHSSLQAKWASCNIDYIILAGFLLKIPQWMLKQFPDRIINIHPALLPKYGGKGMYGEHVHKAVFDSKEEQSGITIHLVNENYDEGKIIFQASVSLTAQDLPEDIAKKIHQLEYQYFPSIIEDYIYSHSIDS